MSIVGCGDVGLRLGRLLAADGATVHAFTRSKARAARLAAAGFRAACLDLDRPVDAGALPPAAALFHFVPPPPRGDDDPRLGRLLAALAARPPRRLVLLSTSAVYGDHRGARVTEDTPPRPASARGRRRLAAERRLAAFARENGTEAVILRVGGIYARDRLPLERLRRGEPVLRPELAPPTNRIHADDLAAVCRAAALRGRPGAVYNVCDGSESSMTEYFYTIADCLGLPRPPAVDWAEAERTMSPGMLAYLRESRRMDNRRMLSELGVRLRHPDLRTALGTPAAREA